MCDLYYITLIIQNVYKSLFNVLKTREFSPAFADKIFLSMYFRKVMNGRKHLRMEHSLGVTLLAFACYLNFMLS